MLQSSQSIGRSYRCSLTGSAKRENRPRSGEAKFLTNFNFPRQLPGPKTQLTILKRESCEEERVAQHGKVLRENEGGRRGRGRAWTGSGINESGSERLIKGTFVGEGV